MQLHTQHSIVYTINIQSCKLSCSDNSYSVHVVGPLCVCVLMCETMHGDVGH